MAEKIPPSTDSMVAFQNSQGAEAQGTLLRLNRDTAVFEVYNPYSIVQLSEVLSNVRIRRGNRDVYTGRAVVTNLISTGIMAMVSASLVDPWSDMKDLAPGPELRGEVEGFVNDWESSNQRLRPGYQVSVSNVRNFLEELSRWLEHGEMAAGLTTPDMAPEGVRDFVHDVDAMVSPKFEELFGKFEEETRKVSPDNVDIHKAFARREVHPLTMCAPFIHRTYTKPLGYAGDYEMVRMILRDPLEGQNTYAKVVNSILLKSDTAQAHRNRIVKLVEYLDAEALRTSGYGRPLHVLNIGCGPAAEVCKFIKTNKLSDDVEIELLDFNEETLGIAKGEITRTIRESRRNTSVKFVHRSVHELLKQASGRSQPKAEYDLVYCAGLFDYLNDRICGRLLKLFYAWTRPAGLVLVTNVHTRHPMRGFLEHLQEWYLLLRDEEHLLRLAPNLGRQEVSTEATGVNAFLEIRKADDEGAR